MMSERCERCGKFRRPQDCLYIFHGDPSDPASGEVMECRWCMSPVDRERMECAA